VAIQGAFTQKPARIEPTGSSQPAAARRSLEKSPSKRRLLGSNSIGSSSKENLLSFFGIVIPQPARTDPLMDGDNNIFGMCCAARKPKNMHAEYMHARGVAEDLERRAGLVGTQSLKLQQLEADALDDDVRHRGDVPIDVPEMQTKVSRGPRDVEALDDGMHRPVDPVRDETQSGGPAFDDELRQFVGARLHRNRSFSVMPEPVRPGPRTEAQVTTEPTNDWNQTAEAKSAAEAKAARAWAEAAKANAAAAAANAAAAAANAAAEAEAAAKLAPAAVAEAVVKLAPNASSPRDEDTLIDDESEMMSASSRSNSIEPLRSRSFAELRKSFEYAQSPAAHDSPAHAASRNRNISPPVRPQQAAMAYVSEQLANCSDLEMPDDDDDVRIAYIKPVGAPSPGPAPAPVVAPPRRRSSLLSAPMNLLRLSTSSESSRARRRMRDYQGKFEAANGRRPCTREEWGEHWSTLQQQTEEREKRQKKHKPAKLTASSHGASPSGSSPKATPPATAAHAEGSAEVLRSVRRQLKVYEADFEGLHGRKPRSQTDWGDSWDALVGYRNAKASLSSFDRSSDSFDRSSSSFDRAAPAAPTGAPASPSGAPAPPTPERLRYERRGIDGRGYSMDRTLGFGFNSTPYYQAGTPATPQANGPAPDTPTLERDNSGSSEPRRRSPSARDIETWSREVYRIERTLRVSTRQKDRARAGNEAATSTPTPTRADSKQSAHQVARTNSWERWRRQSAQVSTRQVFDINVSEN